MWWFQQEWWHCRSKKGRYIRNVYKSGINRLADLLNIEDQSERGSLLPQILGWTTGHQVFEPLCDLKEQEVWGGAMGMDAI